MENLWGMRMKIDFYMKNLEVVFNKLFLLLVQSTMFFCQCRAIKLSFGLYDSKTVSFGPNSLKLHILSANGWDAFRCVLSFLKIGEHQPPHWVQN